MDAGEPYSAFANYEDRVVEILRCQKRESKGYRQGMAQVHKTASPGTSMWGFCEEPYNACCGNTCRRESESAQSAE